MSAQRATEFMDGMRDVELLMRVDTDGDAWQARCCGDDGLHCGPSYDRSFSGWVKGRAAGTGTILLRDAWSRSYQVTPCWRFRAEPSTVDGSDNCRHTQRVAGKEMSQTVLVRTRTLPTQLLREAAETPVVL